MCYLWYMKTSFVLDNFFDKFTWWWKPIFFVSKSAFSFQISIHSCLQENFYHVFVLFLSWMKPFSHSFLLFQASSCKSISTNAACISFFHNFWAFFSYFFRKILIGTIISVNSLSALYLDVHTLLILSWVFFILQFSCLVVASESP